MDSSAWMSPPPSGSDGTPPIVDFRVHLFRFGCVDTASQQAYVKLNLLMYWTDPRMVGWSAVCLPPLLWGPHPRLSEAGMEFLVTQEQFVVANPETGRMKRGLYFEGKVEHLVEQSAQSSFPFDCNDVLLSFFSFCHWSTFDLTPTVTSRVPYKTTSSGRSRRATRKGTSCSRPG